MSVYHRVPAATFASRRVSHPSAPQYHRPSPVQKSQTVEANVSARHPNVSIPRLREAIHSLDSKMASLMIQRHELEAHLEQAVRLQSPIHRLPNELLRAIFVIGVLRIEDENPVMVPTLMLVWSVVCPTAFCSDSLSDSVQSLLGGGRSRYSSVMGQNFCQSARFT